MKKTFVFLLALLFAIPCFAASLEKIKKAAEKGNPIAQYNLGFLYYTGEGVVPKDYTEAEKWFLKSAEKGNAEAMNILGIMYAHGEGVAKKPEEAEKWWSEAADKGSTEARQNLLMMEKIPSTLQPLTGTLDVNLNINQNQLRNF